MAVHTGVSKCMRFEGSFIMQDDTLVMSGFVVEPATATAATSNGAYNMVALLLSNRLCT